nr:double homeobox protein 1-like [Macaca nemestrina]
MLSPHLSTALSQEARGRGRRRRLVCNPNEKDALPACFERNPDPNWPEGLDLSSPGFRFRVQDSPSHLSLVQNPSWRGNTVVWRKESSPAFGAFRVLALILSHLSRFIYLQSLRF